MPMRYFDAGPPPPDFRNMQSGYGLLPFPPPNRGFRGAGRRPYGGWPNFRGSNGPPPVEIGYRGNRPYRGRGGRGRGNGRARF